MTLGYPSTKNDVDSRIGGLALSVRNDFAAVANFKLWLDAQTDQVLTGLGYDSTDISRLRSAAADLNRLGQIYLGADVQATAYDFRAFAKFTTGTS